MKYNFANNDMNKNMMDNDGINELNAPNMGDKNPQTGMFGKKIPYDSAVNAVIDETKDKIINIQYPQARVFNNKPYDLIINAERNAVAEKIVSIQTSSQSNITGGAIMSSNQSLAHQLELLEDLKRHIQLLQNQMESMMQHYRTKIQNLHDAGMMIERHGRLQRQVFEPTNDIMNRFIQHLQERDLLVVEMVVQKVAADLADEQRGGR